MSAIRDDDPDETETIRGIELSRRDEDLADLFEEVIGADIRYNAADKRWSSWREFYWSADEAHVYNLLVAAVRNMLAGASKARVSILANMLDVRKQESVLKALSRRPALRLDGDEFDQVEHLLGVQNGVVDLRTATFWASGYRLEYVSKRAAVAWDPGAQCPRFVQFLKEIMSGDDERADYLLSVLGYSLFGWQREQKFWLLVGKLGQNGKGTLMKVMNRVLGEYSKWMDPALYMASKYARGAGDANPALLDLMGVRLTPMSEPGGGQFNDELVKAHTGDDPIRARTLYSADYAEFRPTHTILFATNDAPKVADVGGAMRRRVRVIEFREDFRGEREDKDLEATLMKEAPGILALLAKMAAHYFETGALLPEPADVTEASDRYIESNDALADFVTERCLVDAHASVPAAVAWQSLQDWAATDPDRPAMTQTEFGTAFAKRFERKRIGKSRVSTYLGVRTLRTDEVADQESDQEA